MATTKSELVFTASDQTGAAFKSVENRLKGVGQSSTGLTQKLGGGLSGTIAQAAAAALSLDALHRVFMEHAKFEQDVLRASQNAGQRTTANTAQIREAILKTSQETTTARTEVAELFKAYTQGGMSVDNATASLKAGAEAMQVFGTTSTETGTALALVTRQFGVTTEQALEIISRSGRAADIFRAMPRIGEIAADIGERGEAGLAKLVARISTVTAEMGGVEEAANAAAAAMNLMRQQGFKENISKWAGADVDQTIKMAALKGIDEFEAVARLLEDAARQFAATKWDIAPNQVSVQQLAAAMQELVGGKAGVSQFFRLLLKHKGDVNAVARELTAASQGAGTFATKLAEADKLPGAAWDKVLSRLELVKIKTGEVMDTVGVPAFLDEMAERIGTTAEEIGGLKRLFEIFQGDLNAETVKKWWDEWKAKTTSTELRELNTVVDDLIAKLKPAVVKAFWKAMDATDVVHVWENLSKWVTEALRSVATGMKPGNDVEVALRFINELLDTEVVKKFWAAFIDSDVIKFLSQVKDVLASIFEPAKPEKTAESIKRLNEKFGTPAEVLGTAAPPVPEPAVPGAVPQVAVPAAPRAAIPGAVPQVPAPAVPRAAVPGAVPQVPVPAAPAPDISPETKARNEKLTNFWEALKREAAAPQGPDAPGKEQTQQRILDEQRAARGLWQRFVDIFARSTLMQHGNEESFGGGGPGGGRAGGVTGPVAPGGGEAPSVPSAAGGSMGGAGLPVTATGGAGPRGGTAGARNVRYGGQSAVRAGGGQGPGAATVGRTPSGAANAIGRSGGSRSWRNNNPGNIEYGEFAKSMGAVGSDGRFAIFPSLAAGNKARESLFFEGKNYSDLTLAQATARWAPGSENNVPAYIKALTGSGVSAETRMRDFTPEQRASIMESMRKHEGWNEGTQATPGAPMSRTAGAPTDSRLGVNPQTHGLERADPRLKEILHAASSHLPSGYRAEIVSAGRNANAPGFHPRGKAIDLRIIDDKGRAIPHEGEDTTGQYTRFARAAYGEQQARYPDLTGKFGWGGAFETSRGSGVKDLMHFDLGGDRGQLAPQNQLRNIGVLPGEQYGGRKAPVARDPDRMMRDAAPNQQDSGADEIARMRKEAQKPIPIRFEGNMPAIRDRGALQARREMNNEMRQARSSSFSDVGVA